MVEQKEKNVQLVEQKGGELHDGRVEGGGDCGSTREKSARGCDFKDA
jgi:hypothetical protein